MENNTNNQEEVSATNNESESQVTRKPRKTLDKITFSNILRLRNLKWNANQIAISNNCSLQCIYAVLKRWETHKAAGGDLNSFFGKPGRIPQQNSPTKEKILEFITDNTTLNQSGLKEKLSQNNIFVSQSTISKNLKSLNFSRKKLTKIVSPNDPVMTSKRQQYAIQVRNVPDCNLFFIDESGLILH
jgi:hypothetical protein